MKPELTGYRIQQDGLMLYVASKYDLMHINQWHRCSPNYDTAQEAHYWLYDRFLKDTNEYERLKAIGRSFPDND
jgi:hypothetical protein